MPDGTFTNLIDAILECLMREPGRRFSAREIAKCICRNYPDWSQVRIDRSPNISDSNALEMQIAAEIHGRRNRLVEQHPKVEIFEGSPRRFCYTESSDSEATDSASVGASSTGSSGSGGSSVRSERDLYELLMKFLWSEFKVVCKRINESRSTNSAGKGANKWRFPDVVGLTDRTEDWDPLILKLAKTATLWSCEVKMRLDISNAREAYLQAASNSVWANIGYLVASEISGTDTMNELNRLASTYGIGVIKLDIENPAESVIMIPASQRDKIDWEAVNKLVQENRDFRRYMELVNLFYSSGCIDPVQWDTPIDEE